MQLVLRKIDKNGLAIYEVPNLRGSVYITKSMFVGEPPQTFDTEGIEFAPPGAGGSGRVPDPEKVRKAMEAAAKAAERAQKAQERADKLAARVKGLESSATAPEAAIGEVNEVSV